jgi:ribosomal protein S18 acetylase RimI-like enzyme
MPETRAAKRVRLTNPEKIVAPKPKPLAPHEAHLRRLNSLSPKDFLSKYVPSEKLSFCSRKRPGANYRLDYYNVEELPKEDMEKCFALLIQTSKEDYAPSTRGWHPKKKRKEMKEDNMRYLIVRKQASDIKVQEQADTSTTTSSMASPQRTASSQDSGIALAHESRDLDDFGFMSYQLDDDWTVHSDDNIPVLYIYEIHLGQNLRGIGIGKHLMGLATHISYATSMDKVELTVFTSNVDAELFYRSLGFETDETSFTTVKKGSKMIKTDWLILSLKTKRDPPGWKLLRDDWKTENKAM